MDDVHGDDEVNWVTDVPVGTIDDGIDTVDSLAARVKAQEEAAAAAERRRHTIEWIIVIVGALVVAFIVKTFLIQAFYIPSASMEPTLMINDRVLVNKISYDLHDVNRGDLIVFKRPLGEADPNGIEDLIKRVIALPGETVSFRDGRVIIDGRFLDEPYLEASVFTTPDGNESVTIPEGHVFVMGDNRSQSSDSRRFGPIPDTDIVGRAFVRFWPPSEWSML